MTNDNLVVGDVLICHISTDGECLTKYIKNELVQIESFDGIEVRTINTRGGRNSFMWRAYFSKVSSGVEGDIDRFGSL